MSSSSTTQPAPIVDVPKPERPNSGTRMPSLNQLAARINLNPGANPASAAARPRLAAALLRTNSQSSLSTTASTNDSVAANPAISRSDSPANLSTSPPGSSSTTPAQSEAEQGEQLTTEKLEKLNKETEKKEKMPMGYKNIPSLDAITARLAKARSLSVDGTAKPPEAETIEDPKTPGLRIKAPEHPLENKWTIYHDTKAKAPFTPASAMASQAPNTSTEPPPSATHFQPPESDEYEAGLTVIGEFDTVESFCRYFNWLKMPSRLERNSNYHLFKSGIKPMWEDPANANGGKWVLTMKNNPQLLDRCWSWLAMALVGEDLDEGDEICGAVVSLRSKVDRIQLWTRGKDDVEKINGIGRKMVKLLDISESDGIGLEFQYNNDDRPVPNKFLTIQALPQTSYRSSFYNKNSPMSDPGEGPGLAGGAPNAPASGGGAFAGFGVGGLGGSGWRSKQQRP